MSNFQKINAANPRNFRTIEAPKLKSLPQLSDHHNVVPNNKAYLSGYNPSREFNRDKIIQQNRNLKAQVLQLAHHMDQILTKSQKKKKYGINLDEELDGGTEVQKLEAKKQEAKIIQLKNEIFSLKKENEYVWDEKTVIEKQNGIKALEAQMKPLEQQLAGLLKIRKQQQKALHFLKDDSQYSQKIQKTRSQLLKIKDQCKNLSQKTLENERLLLKAHEKTVTKSKKIKEIEERIKENKQKLKKGQQNIVTIEMISQIQQEIMKLQSEYKQLQKTWQDKISNLEAQHNNRKIEQQKKLMILKEKQKEVKLNDIRMKEFRKLIVQHRADSKMESPDNPKQFRNKRNIKYLERTPQ